MLVTVKFLVLKVSRGVRGGNLKVDVGTWLLFFFDLYERVELTMDRELRRGSLWGELFWGGVNRCSVKFSLFSERGGSRCTQAFCGLEWDDERILRRD
jgi:hypothetical protein